MSKINLWWIVRQHLSTLVDYPNKRISIQDISLFIAFPVILATFAALFDFNLNTDVLNGIMAAFSIFAGLLLNLLVLVFSFTQVNSSQPVGPTDAYFTVRRRLLREIHANISFAIVVSVAVVVVALIALWNLKHANKDNPGTTGWVTTSLIALLVSNFVLTLMMVIKRMNSIIGNELDRPMPKRSVGRADLSA